MEEKQDIKVIKGFEHVKYKHIQYTQEEMIERSKQFYDWMETRRSVREFSDKPVPKEVIDNILRSASTAPSGAHKQPWTFCVVSNPEIKSKIREAAEKEEYESYTKRMSEEWIDDLKPMATDWKKPFLEIAPYLVIVFKRPFEYDSEGKKKSKLLCE